MAFHKVGDRILTSDEYYDDMIFKWKIGLFVLGGLFAGFALHISLPPELPKILRFILIAVSGAAGGGILSYFAREIESMAGWAVRLGVVFLIGCIVWNLI